MAEIFRFLNEASPLAVIALLAYVVYLLVSKRGPVRTISENHLHDTNDSLRRIEAMLESIARDIAYVRGRINGRG